MESGQGNIDLSIKKPEPQKPPVARAHQTDTPGLHVINLNLEITWPKKPLPTKLPDEGQHGGMVYKKNVMKNINDRNSKYNNLELYVSNVGFGAGGIVRVGEGPILLGIGSTGISTGFSLLWIVILLIITAIMWAIRHIRVRRYRRQRIRKGDSGNWIHNAIEKDRQSYSKDNSIINGHGPSLNSIAKVTQRSLMSEPASPQSRDISLSNYGVYARPGTVRSNKGASTASILSFTSTLGESGIVPTSSLPVIMRVNQAIVCQKTGVIFTVSEKNGPNSYLTEDLSKITICQPSEYYECVEVFLLAQESVLVGKMKNNRGNSNMAPYILITWSTTDGVINNSGHELATCISVCTIKDDRLVVLNKDVVSILEVPSGQCMSQIKCPLLLAYLPNVAVIIQSTRDMGNVVISETASQNVTIYVLNVENIQNGRSEIDAKSQFNNASSYTVISSSQIVVAINSTDIILWNFVDNTKYTLLENCDQDIQNLFSSPTGELVLMQFAERISVLQTSDWDHLFSILINAQQVCAIAFSSPSDDSSFLAVAMDNGTIQIHNNYTKQLHNTVKLQTPVSSLMFYDQESSLFTLADRASHFRLKKFAVK